MRSRWQGKKEKDEKREKTPSLFEDWHGAFALFEDAAGC
jgi:hypothetical protein